ncbi:polysaccharide biosynthesis/export family protein [Shimia aestuarii]|nr:polysaccharide biosynthesis/export family protein [Shimia aestuarii]
MSDFGARRGQEYVKAGIMRRITCGILALVACLLLVSCSLPRGAATKGEVVGENAIPDDVTMVEVTRTSVVEVAKWPSAGWHGHYHWFSRVNGPGSKIIKPGDRVILTIWDNQDNSLLLGPGQRSVQVRPVEVSSSGAIFVPYVDEVFVGGLTPEQAREQVQNQMSAIAPSAQVQLEVQSGTRNSIDMVSGVKKPGQVELTGRNDSILWALAQGGGIDPVIQNPIVRIMRDGQSYEIPADELLKDPKKNVIVRGGDQVIVSENDRFFVALGASETEKLVYFDRENISVVEAMSSLGGLQDLRANPQGVLLLREYPKSAIKPNGFGPETQYVVFSFNMTTADGLFGAKKFMMQPGDVVMATESALKPAQAVIALLGSLFAINNIIN